MEANQQKDILKLLRSLQTEMVSTLKTFTNIDSPATSKESVDTFSAVLEKSWNSLGGCTSFIQNERRGNHLRVEWGTGEEQILILCHMDTVWSQGEAEKRPFRVEGNVAYGPGAYDMKGGIVEGLFAIKALSELELAPPHKVIILHNSDEEIGSPTSRQIIEEEAKKSKGVFVLEPSAAEGALKTWRKGIGMFQVTISGRASHAGSDYEKGVSAIVEAAHQILHLNKLTDLEEGTTVNVGVIRGGSRTNVVADETTLGIDVRVKSTEAANRVIPKILGLRPLDPRISLVVKGGLNRPPMERNNKNLALFHLAKSIGADMGIELLEGGTGGGSDGNFTSALGIPTLDGLGPVGGDAHALSEYVVVPSLPERAALLAGLILQI